MGGWVKGEWRWDLVGESSAGRGPAVLGVLNSMKSSFFFGLLSQNSKSVLSNFIASRHQ